MRAFFPAFAAPAQLSPKMGALCGTKSISLMRRLYQLCDGFDLVQMIEPTEVSVDAFCHCKVYCNEGNPPVYIPATG